ncbi:NAD(+)/NADH kinase [Natrialbaceae archaeon GCM10025810]|uniref:NAD(+)/NADH kinase n=1 Tax=Halovalidus salilacus TaxID=3075124 RepID=UPI003614BC7F
MVTDEWTVGDDPVVGVVRERDGDAARGNDATESAVADAVDAVDAADAVASEPVVGSVPDVLESDPSLLLAVGDRSLSATARAGADTPVLAIDAGPGIVDVPLASVRAALDRIFADGADARIRELSVLGVDAGGTDLAGERALFDATLVTEEPAKISEYAVSSRGERVGRFRADGVVVATAAGSEGYANAVGAPRLSPAVDGLTVVPIAPFVTDRDQSQWVLPDDDLSISIVRDESAVCLVVDGRTSTPLPPGSRVSIVVADTLRTLVVPEIREE